MSNITASAHFVISTCKIYTSISYGLITDVRAADWPSARLIHCWHLIYIVSIMLVHTSFFCSKCAFLIPCPARRGPLSAVKFGTDNVCLTTTIRCFLFTHSGVEMEGKHHPTCLESFVPCSGTCTYLFLSQPRSLR